MDRPRDDNSTRAETALKSADHSGVDQQAIEPARLGAVGAAVEQAVAAMIERHLPWPRPRPQVTVLAALVNPKSPNAEISMKDAQDAARAGVKGLDSGTRVVVPGLPMRGAMLAWRYIPHAVKLPVLERIMRGR